MESWRNPKEAPGAICGGIPEGFSKEILKTTSGGTLNRTAVEIMEGTLRDDTSVRISEGALRGILEVVSE